MRVFFDHQIFTLQDFGGISRYFVELMKLMGNEKDIEFILPNIFSNNVNLRELNLKNVKSFVSYQSFLRNNKFDKSILVYKVLRKLGFFIDAEKKNRKSSIAEMESKDFEIFHPTYYSTYFLDSLKQRRIPFVLTVYDMIHELYPNLFNDSKEVILKKKICIDNSDLIFAISHSTKRDLIDIYNIPSEKILVTHLASNFFEDPDYIETKAINAKEYILFVGNRDIYKNFTFALEAITPLLRENPDLNFLCVGGGNFSSEERKFISKLEIESQVRYIDITHQSDLSFYYKFARFFFFPSLYEGFGIPLLEAMNVGCVIACSNTSSFTEVAGDSVFYFNPVDSDSILSAAKGALYDENQREVYKKKMKIQSLQFSWEQTYHETKNGYKKLVSI
ncbi:glycosyltransferase family 4 protein [Leptospira levettii]|uniref:glycosyltransferase family 4 protein n=1 Tax=Leptospira levettii TaxID=2023178 RepID=UPI000C2A7F47|nr:glycosyltransferase family 1 protein [Leptospira levettii]MCW7472065.1 glycosyltransferase family 4 protein [Leptospira levettii]PJZ89449.1 hypothetical protein CH368_06710 [Leptospira levettii]